MIKYIYVNFIQLTVTNFFVVIGFLPFIILLSNISSLMGGYYFMNSKIVKVEYSENGGRHNGSCYNAVYFLDKNGVESMVYEKCENISSADINKNIYLRIDNTKDESFLGLTTSTPLYNSIISVDGNKIESRNVFFNTGTLFSFLGLIMFIFWLKFSLIPRIRGTHPLQTALKNKSNIKNQIK